MNDKKIIQRIKSGDKKELGNIYTHYRSEFLSWIMRNYQCELDEAKDYYQFAIMVLYKNISHGKLDNLKSSIKTYVFAIGKNQLLLHKRKNTKFSRDIIYNVIDHSEEEQKEKTIYSNNIELIHKCLESIGDKCKQLIELCYFKKLSMDNITDLLGYKNRETTKNLKYKCMQKLRKLVENESSQTIDQFI
ncbi:sigma-70 family RNA polymerase sigma factor [Fulvivirgaceae bacterium BMA10]|uniref:Sigma-70 family RNA polymerase sigma factor n=1 Tax=Splendidivirga corallicola TaxID=3051826 RepID=A0ABT8KI30_9BACT|nr:sigma-70 family RNA polymerase sigma factor [Fulvivirgaceae bacterium BMA10]